jgi:DNA-binding MarR family transcriptional regulator
MGQVKFDLEESLSHLMARASRALGNRLQSVFAKVGYDLTVEQWIILLVLSGRNGQFQQQLADITSKDKTSMTRLIDGMEKRGLVKRSPDTVDRRQKRICLTSRGKQLRQKLIPLVHKNLRSTQRNIAPEQLKICKNVLRKVYENIGAR